MVNIVILGAGIGGVMAAYEMKRQVGREHDVTVVNKNPYFQFTPSNPWVGVGWRSKENIIVDLPPVLKKCGINFICDEVTKLHPEKKRVELASGDEVNYDYLIIATGPDLAFDEIEGLGPEGHTQSICQVDHALKANTYWEEFCANPGPIVVGAVQGASCYGPAYEYATIMDTDLCKRGIRDKVPITFVTAEPYIGHLGLGGVGDTKRILESEMRDRHIKWITNAKVDKVEKGMLYVTEVNSDGSKKNNHELPFNYSMMLPAFRGIPAVMGIEGLVNPRGFITVDEFQRNGKYPEIFAVGVCIAIPPLEATPVAVGVPKTGYMIESMVSATVKNIKELLDGQQPSHKPTLNAFCLADFGNKGIAFIAKPQNPPRNMNWASGGKWVHLAKVAFEKYFLRKVKKGQVEPFFEKYVMNMINVHKVK